MLVCLFTCWPARISIFKDSSIPFGRADQMRGAKGKSNGKWIGNRQRGLVGRAAAPCGKCFQPGLPKSAICPHDGPAALGRMHPGSLFPMRFGKERKFGKRCPSIAIRTKNGTDCRWRFLFVVHWFWKATYC